jgi:hypothetical protein
MFVTGCGSDYWVRRDAAAGTGWVAARRVRDDAPVAIRDDGLRTWRVRRDGTRRVSGHFRNEVAFGGGLLLTALGTGAATLGAAFAGTSDSLGINRALGLYIGVPGAIVAIAGGGLLWWGWPISVRAEPIAAHPGLGEPPPSSAPTPSEPTL